MNLEIKDIAILVFAVISAGWAAFEHFKKYKVERAKWLAIVYEKFYERNDLKRVREIIDCGPDKTLEITRLVGEEPSEFTDYLNFFEFVASLKKFKQLNDDEIEYLFGYYLECLERSKYVRDYIRTKGYEQLDALLIALKRKQ